MNLVKKFITWLIVLGVIAVIVWQAVMFISEQSKPHADVTLKGAVFKARVVSTPEDRDKGLSGVKSLGKNEGMLFVFDKDDTYGIWMKDMTISIDIVWLDADKKVIYIVKRADPSSYPYTTYRPTKPARYILELPAGTADSKDIRSGDKAIFDLSSLEGSLK